MLYSHVGYIYILLFSVKTISDFFIYRKASYKLIYSTSTLMKTVKLKLFIFEFNYNHHQNVVLPDHHSHATTLYQCSVCPQFDNYNVNAFISVRFIHYHELFHCQGVINWRDC